MLSDYQIIFSFVLFTIVLAVLFPYKSSRMMNKSVYYAVSYCELACQTLHM